MKFDFRKAFSSAKSLPMAPIRNITVDELGRVFSGSANSTWSREGEMRQYGKSLYVFAGVNKIAVKVASIEMSLYRITGLDGNDTEIFQHPLLDLLARPNAFQTRSEFFKIAWINKKLTGETFLWKVRNKQGQVVELWNLRPDLMTIVSDPNKFINRYEFRKFDGDIEVFDPADIIFIKDPDPMNSFRGMSPIAVAKTRIETETSATQYQRDFFKNNARPDALLITEETLDTEQRSQMTTAWDEEHQGPKKTSKIGILEGGMKYQQVSISQREMDYIESSKFTRDDILVALGIPKSVITTDAVTYNNIDIGMRTFLSETIKPEMEQLVEVFNEMLVIPDFGEDIYLDYLDPTPADRDAQLKENVAGWGHWLTTNEIREGYNLPEVADGDTISPLPYAPKTGTSTNQPAAEAPPTPKFFMVGSRDRARRRAQKRMQGRPQLRQKFELIAVAKAELQKLKAMKMPKLEKGQTLEKVSLFLEDDTRKMYYELMNKRIDRRSVPFKKAILKEAASQQERVIAKLSALPKKGRVIYTKAGVEDLLNVSQESKLFANIALPFIVEYALAGGDDAGKLTGETFSYTDVLQKLLEKRARFFAESVTDTTFQKLTKTITEGIDNGEGIVRLKSRVNDVYTEYPDYRAEMIARTETTYANNAGALAQYKQSAVVKGKEWIATEDGRTRETHQQLDGEIVGVEELFSNGLDYPGDDRGEAKETINCRCALSPALEGKSIFKKKVVDKGGGGSGNHGHAGRPGTQGGSASSPAGGGVATSVDAATLRSSFEGEVTNNNGGIVKPYGDLDYDETLALKAYTGRGYSFLNEDLRTKPQLDDVDSSLTKFMDTGLKKLPIHEGAVYRGIRPPEGTSPKSFVDSFTTGKIVKDKAYTSTTALPEVASVFARNGSDKAVILKITSTSGRSLDGVSAIVGESEVLFPRGTRFRVTDVLERDDHYMITMDEAKSKSMSLSTLFMFSLSLSEVAHKNSMNGRAPGLPEIIYENSKGE